MITALNMYDEKQEDGSSFRLTASLDSDGSLVLEGQDFTPVAKEIFGDREVEYYYVFSPNEAKKLFSILEGEEPLLALKETFFQKGIDNNPLLTFCDNHGIEYRKIVI